MYVSTYPSIHQTFLASLRPFLVCLPINLKWTVRVQSKPALQNSTYQDVFSRRHVRLIGFPKQ